jgi:hypothetical protein
MGPPWDGRTHRKYFFTGGFLNQCYTNRFSSSTLIGYGDRTSLSRRMVIACVLEIPIGGTLRMRQIPSETAQGGPTACLSIAQIQAGKHETTIDQHYQQPSCEDYSAVSWWIYELENR